MDMTKYLDVFIEESKELFNNLNQALLELESNPDDISVINEVFRLIHTLKGMAGTLGFEKTAQLTHRLEDELQEVRSNKKKVNKKLLDILFKALDYLDESIEAISQTGKESDKTFDFFEDTERQEIQFNSYEERIILTAKEMSMKAFMIRIELSKDCIMKSVRAFMVFRALENLGEIIKSVPIVQDIEDEKFENDFTVVLLSKAGEEKIYKDLSNISEIERIIIKEVVLNKNSLAEDEKNIIEQKADKQKNNITIDKPEQEYLINNHSSEKAKKAGKTVRVDIERLDVLLNLVSELIIQKTRLAGLEINDESSVFNETLEQLERITVDLHDAVMKVRMVPLETVFSRFPRMIRNLSNELNKDMELIITGANTELDRTVVDEIGEPLIHLLRNSADHGLESNEERKKLGKPEKGKIYLRAFQEGNHVIIEVEDDGKGLDFNKIKEKALEKNLINREKLNSMSEQGIIELLFMPGFSTANEITDISGRGVGLDVVKTKIQSLGGTIDIATKPGEGTKFSIHLPLTLAIMKALMITCGNEKYALKMDSIQQIIEINSADIRMVQKKEAIMVRNNLIPILRLDKVLGVPEKSENEDVYTVVLAKSGEQFIGLVVDSILGQQEIVQKPLGKYLSAINISNSATILGDGSVALILNVNYLIQLINNL
ncbi:MAG TPA: chemotaxis protein CheA [Clostridiaceae bacterium]|nr:chemotaxis protein CheA [Clostridiaceae bacterium]